MQGLPAGQIGGLPAWLRNMAALFTMKVCMSISFNAIRNIKFTEYSWNAEQQTCTYERKSKGELYTFDITYYLVEFFLPVMGGLAVDKWFGELKVFRVAGVLLLLSGLYMTAVEMGQLICHPVVYIIGLIPGCLAYGVGVAPLVAAPQKLAHGHFGSPTPGLLTYYFAAALGEIIGYLPQYARPTIDITWVVCVSSFLYIAASAVLDVDWTEYRQRFQHQLEDGFQFPTRTRLLRYFVLLAPLILMVSVMATVRTVTYCPELNYYLNCTGNCTVVTCIEVFGVFDVSTMFTMLLLGALYKAGCLSREGRISARFYSGALLLMLTKAALIPWHCWAAAQPQQPDPNLTHIVYGTASALDGIGNGLGLASGYEMMYRIAPAHSKSFVMGILFTMWAIGACISGLLAALLKYYPVAHPILNPVFGYWNSLHVASIIMAIESALLLLYFVCFGSRLAHSMMTTDDTAVEVASASSERTLLDQEAPPDLSQGAAAAINNG